MAAISVRLNQQFSQKFCRGFCDMVFSFGVTERGLSILPECKNLFVGAPDECLK